MKNTKPSNARKLLKRVDELESKMDELLKLVRSLPGPIIINNPPVQIQPPVNDPNQFFNPLPPQIIPGDNPQWPQFVCRSGDVAT